MGTRIETTGNGRVALAPWPEPAGELGRDEVEGATVVSLVSPGTELQGVRGDDETPRGTGYAAVFRISAVGADVRGLTVGQLVFCMGNHAGFQRFPAREVVPVPEGLDPAIAVFCRLMAVSWTTLVTTTARPDERVLVTGLGIVGNLAAQMFHAAGYRVTAVDPVPARRELASAVGLPDVLPSTPVLGEYQRVTDPMFGAFALAVDCSGHEGAVLDAARAVRRGGEVVLVGVPWQQRTEIAAHALLDVVFHHYVSVRSGWEWQLPREPEPFRTGSTVDSLAGAMRWLAEGRVDTGQLAALASPADAQSAFDSLADAHRLTVLFTWGEH